ncbi:MAG: DDE-type integrase/transposase/recombinase [Cyanobacteria bacterium P01_F01_bin.150]
MISIDKNAAYPPAIEALQTEERLPDNIETRQSKYINNTIEQDHRFIK